MDYGTRRNNLAGQKRNGKLFEATCLEDLHPDSLPWYRDVVDLAAITTHDLSGPGPVYGLRMTLQAAEFAEDFTCITMLGTVPVLNPAAICLRKRRLGLTDNGA